MVGFINSLVFYGVGRYGSLRQTVRMKNIFGFIVCWYYYYFILLTFVSLLINFILNFLLINGFGAITGLGSKGSAIATLTGRIVEFILVSIFIVWKKYEFQPKLVKMFKIRGDLLKKY